MTQLCLSVPAGTAVVRRRRCWADRYFHELLLCGVASGSLITAVRETTSHFATACCPHNSVGDLCKRANFEVSFHVHSHDVDFHSPFPVFLPVPAFFG
ncbi:hypothetical protein Y032_0016g2917 [Ancylostoma ceylanicum]|nr:hypothetical protein Y032_0016g2917 [Ancylostoma ceylanicum]